MGKLVKKRFSFVVDSADSNYSRKFDLDKTIKCVRGILLSSAKPNLLFYRGSQRLEISGEEIFPEDFESRLLMSGISVAPDHKYFNLGEVLSGNGEVKILYKDKGNSLAPFEAYEVSVYLNCELA